jgi:hypothetical protein
LQRKKPTSRKVLGMFFGKGKRKCFWMRKDFAKKKKNKLCPKGLFQKCKRGIKTNHQKVENEGPE